MKRDGKSTTADDYSSSDESGDEVWAKNIDSNEEVLKDFKSPDYSKISDAFESKKSRKAFTR